MPLYEYECNDCEHRFERIQKFSDPLVSICPVCDGKVRKLVSSPAIQFKGTGWYVTDYAKKPSGDQPSGAAGEAKAGGDGKAGAKQAGNGKDSGASESKAASSSTSKSESAASTKKPASRSAAAR